ncbi:heterokaryon incompatibility protein-domain-containing protein [Cercophora newfieldiana]|uniref:Heterokaryon incompatibility protein-domain-containing protein n=1 Tax=Cercophora newfieldiana TaxID=92897 RepID=A0AA40CNJ1_9PEZI|nr:heterokaryon incompatibility protein-domain-containing protein [Cercophora newfieldiana]
MEPGETDSSVAEYMSLFVKSLENAVETIKTLRVRPDSTFSAQRHPTLAAEARERADTATSELRQILLDGPLASQNPARIARPRRESLFASLKGGLDIIRDLYTDTPGWAGAKSDRFISIWSNLEIQFALEELKENLDHMQRSPLRQTGFPYCRIQSPSGIRLLRLLPHEHSDATIECHLLEVDHYEDRTYAALSYVWGEQTEQKLTILLDDHPFQVTPNLHEALKHFRHESRPRLLWVDAICINQQDVAEKSDQVSRMQRIYQNAYTIIMWAGRRSQSSNVAMGVLLGLESVFEPSDQDPPSPNDIYPYLMHPVIPEKLVPAVVADPNGRATRVFFDRPYWHRVWTLQEAVVGSKSLLCCGDYGVTWSAVAKTALDSKGIAIAIGLARTDTSASVTDTLWMARVFDPIIQHATLTARHRFGEPISLVDGFVAGRAYDASDARDHVYGVLAIVDDSHDVHVDYDKPSFRVYMDVVREQIHRSGNFDILSACRMWNFTQHRERFVPLEGLVQSCLDDDLVDTPELARVSEVLRSWPESTGRVIAFELARGHSPHRMNEGSREPEDLDGLGSFEEMAMAWLPSWVPRWDIPDDAKRLVTLLGRKGEASLHATPGTSARYAFTGYAGSCLQVSGARVDVVLNIATAGDFASMWDHWVETQAASLDGNVPISTEKSSHARKAVAAIAELASSWGQQRRFIVTGRGFMGLGPMATESGDVVCVLFGGQVPFLLRPLQQGGFYLVGEAYIEGLMQGEILGMLDRGQVVREDFRLV